MLFKVVAALVLLAAVCNAQELPGELVTINGAEYFLSDTPGTLYEVWQTCFHRGMEVINVETRVEAQAIFEYLETAGGNMRDRKFMTGGSRAGDEVDFFWSNGVMMTEEESFWSAGYPSLPSAYNTNILLHGARAGFIDEDILGLPLHSFCEWPQTHRTN